MSDIFDAFHSLRTFFVRHDIPLPDGIELRFSNELAAHRFEAALKHDADLTSPFWTIDEKRNRVSEIHGLKVQPTFQQHGPPYSVDMLPAHHPAITSGQAQ